MNWYKRATITEFNGPSKSLAEAQQRYLDGTEMVRYHAIWELAKMGDWDLVVQAKKDSSPLVRRMAKQILGKR